jgi:hypothetical protein
MLRCCRRSKFTKKEPIAVPVDAIVTKADVNSFTRCLRSKFTKKEPIAVPVDVIVTKTDGITFTFVVKNTDSIYALKKTLEERSGIDVDCQQLFACGVDLDIDETKEADEEEADEEEAGLKDEQLVSDLTSNGSATLELSIIVNVGFPRPPPNIKFLEQGDKKGMNAVLSRENTIVCRRHAAHRFHQAMVRTEQVSILAPFSPPPLLPLPLPPPHFVLVFPNLSVSRYLRCSAKAPRVS